MRVGFWSVDCQGVGFIALSVACREYGLSRHPASCDTRISMCSVPVDSWPESMLPPQQNHVKPEPTNSKRATDTKIMPDQRQTLPKQDPPHA